jgi:hypothetical protein
MGVLKFPKFGLQWLWGPITLYVDLKSRWSLKERCSPGRDLSNGILHATCTQGNWDDSRLLVIKSQIANLTIVLSFGHNLCFRCPNGRCKPISDIYASISFQWHKELFEKMGFDPCNRALKIWEFIWDSNSQHGSSLGSVRVHSGVWGSIPSHSLHSWEHVMWLLDLSFVLQPCNPLPWS